jgi:AcrR family transcriptional regulator
MKSERDDRRVKYTKMVIKESFIDLLGQKDISKITIKEICDNADINRATFYSHYSDQYDLMRKIENELFENIQKYLSGYVNNQSDFNLVKTLEKIFDYIKENAKLCKLLLSERGDLNFQKRVMEIVYDRHIDDMTSGGLITKEDAEYIHSFTITGCIGVIQKWFNDGMKKSAAFMAEMVIKLTIGLPGAFAKKI